MILQIYDLVEQVNEFKLRRDFYLGLASDPKTFIDKWLISQSADLKAMQGAVGCIDWLIDQSIDSQESDVANNGDERKAEYYQQPAVGEAVHRYYYAKIQQRRAELEIGLGIRNCWTLNNQYFITFHCKIGFHNIVSCFICTICIK